MQFQYGFGAIIWGIQSSSRAVPKRFLRAFRTILVQLQNNCAERKSLSSSRISITISERFGCSWVVNVFYKAVAGGGLPCAAGADRFRNGSGARPAENAAAVLGCFKWIRPTLVPVVLVAFSGLFSFFSECCCYSPLHLINRGDFSLAVAFTSHWT